MLRMKTLRMKTRMLRMKTQRLMCDAKRRAREIYHKPSDFYEGCLASMGFCCSQLAEGNLMDEEDLEWLDQVRMAEWARENPWVYSILGASAVGALAYVMMMKAGVK